MSRIDVPYVDPDVGGPALAGAPTVDGMSAGTLDLVLGLPKSFSIYWASLRATGRREEAEDLVVVHEKAIAAALRYLNREAAWATDPPSYWPSSGLRVVQLEHAAAETSKATPPHVHTHLLVEPEVTALHDGRSYPLDVKSLRNELPGAFAVYDLTAESGLTKAFPVKLEQRATSRRREITGVTDDMIRTLSSTDCRPWRHLDQIVVADRVLQ